MAVPGSVVGVGKLITPGGQQGPKGDAGTAANVPLADITQNGLLRQTPGLTTSFVDGTNNYQPLAPVIWSQRLRSFNAVGNPTFEVTQRNCGVALVNPAHGTMIEDRWAAWNNGALNPTFQVSPFTSGKNIPGTSFAITRGYMGMKVGTTKSSLAATDLFGISTQIEGPAWRELQNDVHSLSLLLRSTVNCKLGVSLRDGGTVSKSLTKLITLTANTDTLVQLPNLPVWPAGNFTNAAGSASYSFTVMLACGSTYMSPANDTWQSGNFVGAVGQDNYLANPVNSEVDVFFVQHEPGPVCSTLQDKPFSQSLDECLRYYQKNYDYGVTPGSTAGRYVVFNTISTNTALGTESFYKPMAKQPTVTFYNPNNGAINQCFGLVNGLPYQAAVNTSSPTGISSLTNGANNFPVGAVIGFHYTSDTGW
jgi:hypothetical protein